MCAPMALLLAGTALTAYSQYQAGQSQQKAAEYNANMQRMAALDAQNRGAIDAAQVAEQGKKVESSQNAAFGASGVSGSSGSALDILTETAGMNKLDAMRTVNNANRQAWGMNSQADLDIYQGKAAAQAGTMNAIGTLLTGAGSAYYSGKQAGLWGANKGVK